MLLLAELASAAMDIDIQLKDGMAFENIDISMLSGEEYDYFEYISQERPAAAASAWPTEITGDGPYSVMVERPLTFGLNDFSFTLVYDRLVESAGSGKVFRSSFEHAGPIRLTLTLPEHSTLSGHPSAIPEPTVTTDGTHMILDWEADDELSVSVFYKDPRASPLLYIIPAVSVVFAAAAWVYHSRKAARRLEDSLGPEELKIVTLLKKGEKKQQDIMRELGFSKSKMSKVVRKLEERKVLEKRPHLKTNILKLRI